MMRSKNNFANVTIYALMHRSALEYRRGSEIYKKHLRVSQQHWIIRNFTFTCWFAIIRSSSSVER